MGWLDMRSMKKYLLAAGLSLSTACASSSLYRVQSNLEQAVGDPSFGIILVDMQPYWLRSVEKDEVIDELPNQVELLRYAANHDIPVAILEYPDAKYGSTIDTLATIVNDVPRHKLFLKTYRNGFTNPALAKQLRNWNVDSVLIMGAFATQCVLNTAMGAIDNGFTIATSRQLIMDQRGDGPDEGVAFFAKQGLYSDNYKDFFTLLR